jgi:hypothetical protein
MANTVWSGKKEFTAVSGAETVVSVPAPARGELRGYTLVQLDGAAAGITASLYTSTKSPEEIYHLVNLSTAATVTSDSDVVAILENNSLSIAYQNRDGTPSLHQRYLYLKITPAGTGTKSFVLSITVEDSRVK